MIGSRFPRRLLALLAGVCALASLGSMHVAGQATRACAPRHLSIDVRNIPTDRYLDLGAELPRAPSDRAYTPAGAPWSRPEGAPGRVLESGSEGRYQDLGTTRSGR